MFVTLNIDSIKIKKLINHPTEKEVNRIRKQIQIRNSITKINNLGP